MSGARLRAPATRQILELVSRLTQPGAVGAGMEQRQVVLGRGPRGQRDRTTGGRAGVDQVGEALSRATARPSDLSRAAQAPRTAGRPRPPDEDLLCVGWGPGGRRSLW